MQRRPLLLCFAATGAAGLLGSVAIERPDGRVCSRVPPAFADGYTRLSFAADANRNIMRQHGAVAASAALAAAIRFSRDLDGSAGTEPIPPKVREALLPYFPAESLDRVRWTVAGRRASLGSALAGLSHYNGAVTLDNVVVFTNRRAAHLPGLWAHEMTHVRQYESLGLDTFARCYALDWERLEAEARANAVHVAADRATSRWHRSGPGRRRLNDS